MRLRPVSALTICVTFTGMLAVIGLVAITARSLPEALSVAAATDAGAVETHGNAAHPLQGRDGRSDHLR